MADVGKIQEFLSEIALADRDHIGWILREAVFQLVDNRPYQWTGEHSRASGRQTRRTAVEILNLRIPMSCSCTWNCARERRLLSFVFLGVFSIIRLQHFGTGVILRTVPSFWDIGRLRRYFSSLQIRLGGKLLSRDGDRAFCCEELILVRVCSQTRGQ